MSFPRYPTYQDSGVEWLGEWLGGWGRIRHSQWITGRNLSLIRL